MTTPATSPTERPNEPSARLLIAEAIDPMAFRPLADPPCRAHLIGAPA